MTATPSASELTAWTDNCPHSRVVSSSVEQYCDDCGVVVDSSPIDRRTPLYRDAEGRWARLAPVRFPVNTTQVSFSRRDANGHRVVRDFSGWNGHRLVIRNHVGRPRGDPVRPLLYRLIAQLGIAPGVAPRAEMIARRAREEGATRGASATTLCTAALILATRERRIYAMSMQEAADRIGETRANLVRTYWRIQRALSLRVPLPTSRDILRDTALREETVTPILLGKAQRVLEEFEERTKDAPRGARSVPAVIAAAALYRAAGGPNSGTGWSQRKVAALFRVTEISVRTGVREIEGRGPENGSSTRGES